MSDVTTWIEFGGYFPEVPEAECPVCPVSESVLDDCLELGEAIGEEILADVVGALVAESLDLDDDETRRVLEITEAEPWDYADRLCGDDDDPPADPPFVTV